MIIIYWFIAIILEIASRSVATGSGFTFSMVSALLIGSAVLGRRTDLLIWTSAIIVVNIVTQDSLWEIIPPIIIGLFLAFTHNRFWNGQSSLVNGLLYTGLLIVNSLFILLLEKSISLNTIAPAVIANALVAVGAIGVYWLISKRESKYEVA